MIPNETKGIVKGEYGKTPVEIKQDIVAKVIGSEKRITCRPADMIKPGAVVIDVGVNRDPETGKLCGDVDFAFGGASVMPFENYDRMCRDLMIGYERLHRDHPIFSNFSSAVKPVILSEPMSYTHITGIYTFFTGEANLNVNFPDYSLPFTAAHELAHQRGFAREKEANFIAFLVCINSDQPYTRYSGYVNLVEYLSNALYSANRDLWEDTFYTLDMRIRYEMQAYNDFYDKYRESVAADVSNAVNDTYLKVQGQTEGTKSYGLVVDLAVAHILANANIPQ